MENWGLVTYQQGGLLYEEGVSSLLHKEVIATFIAHELAHQVRRGNKSLCVITKYETNLIKTSSFPTNYKCVVSVTLTIHIFSFC